MNTVPEDYRWLFSLELTDDETKIDDLQYTYTKRASEHLQDRENLDEYLEELSMKNNPNVIYGKYDAEFDERTRITGNKGGKKFGVAQAPTHCFKTYLRPQTVSENRKKNHGFTT